MRQLHIHIKLTCLVVLLVISGQGIVSSDDRMTKTNYKFSLNSDNYFTEIALRVFVFRSTLAPGTPRECHLCRVAGNTYMECERAARSGVAC